MTISHTTVGRDLSVDQRTVQVVRAGRRRRRAPATPVALAEARDSLAGWVLRQWQREAQARSLGDPQPMPVRWTLAAAAVMDHLELIGPVEPVFGTSAEVAALADRFRALRRRRLVITGGAGSGKTTLAVQLVLELAADRGPVPVLFPVAGWDPAVRPTLADWLAERLYQDYPGLRAFGNDTAEALFASGRLLPVLDGLDEIPPDRRSDIFRALNRTLPDSVGLILTSRVDEFAETVAETGVLTATAVVAAHPLDVADAVSYLRLHLPPAPGESWAKVLAGLADAPALASVAASPLGLWLIRTVHIDARRDPAALLTADSAHALTTSLYEQLIPAVIQSRPPSKSRTDLFRPRRHYDPDRMRRWLTTVAVEMRRGGARDWLWWHHAAHTLTPVHIHLRALLVGAICTAALASVISLGPAMVGGAVLTLLNGGWSGRLRSIDRPPVHVNLRFRGRRREVIDAVKTGEVALEIFGVAAFLLVGLTRSWLFALVAGPALGLLFAVGLFFESWSKSESVAQRMTSPLLGYRGDRAYALLSYVRVVLSTVPLYLVVFNGPLLTAAFAAVIAVAAISLASETSAWPSFATSSLLAAARGRLPWRLMTTLDDAHRLGLLRVVGQVYQFRHADLQDHLAATPSGLQ